MSDAARVGLTKPLVFIVAAFCLGGETEAARDEHLDPAGLWYCLVYGHLGLDDWHVSLRLGPGGRASSAWGLALGNRGWRTLSNWSVDDGIISFDDPESGRHYEGDLSRPTLGGTWRVHAESGGWWCAPRALAANSVGLRRSDAAMAVPLVAQIVKAPDYPRQAIREAREGRAVVCFLVDRNGFIVEPEIVELSDEVFRNPTLQAIDRSRFAVSDEPVPLRPGCRSYVYRLDAVR